jgi:hypothetical protein
MEEMEDDGQVDEIEFMTNDGEGGLVIGGIKEVNFSIVLFLTKFDGNGSVVWERSYEKKYIGEPKGIIRTGDGGFIVVGEYGVHLLRVDSKGERVWEEKIQDGIGKFITGGPDDEYIAGGYSRAMADTWYLMKFREYVPEPSMSLVALLLLIAIHGAKFRRFTPNTPSRIAVVR